MLNFLHFHNHVTCFRKIQIKQKLCSNSSLPAKKKKVIFKKRIHATHCFRREHPSNFTCATAEHMGHDKIQEGHQFQQIILNWSPCEQQTILGLFIQSRKSNEKHLSHTIENIIGKNPTAMEKWEKELGLNYNYLNLYIWSITE